MMPFEKPAEVAEALAAVGYLADQQAAVTVYVADRLSKPVLARARPGSARRSSRRRSPRPRAAP